MEKENGNLINLVDGMITENLSEPIVIQQLSEYVGLSKFHLHRVFVAQTGFEIAEYMQRRKMERALALLTAGNSSVIDIALSVGYASHSSFSRVFKQSYGVTPTQVLQGMSCATLINYKKKDKQGMEIPDTEWLYLKERQILGRYCSGFEQSSFAEVANDTFTSLTELSELRDYLLSEPVGVSITNPWSDLPKKAEFFCGLLSGLDNVDASTLETFVWPEGNYISATYVGPYHLMWQFISRLHSFWAQQNQVKIATRQVIQRYLNHPAVTAPEQLRTQLYFKVENVE